jgi:hypothetical protein
MKSNNVSYDKSGQATGISSEAMPLDAIEKPGSESLRDCAGVKNLNSAHKVVTHGFDRWTGKVLIDLSSRDVVLNGDAAGHKSEHFSHHEMPAFVSDIVPCRGVYQLFPYRRFFDLG